MESPAIILQQYDETPLLETVTLTGPGSGEVLVELVASGICHTDLSYMRDARTVPVLLGHEGAGFVREVGAGVTRVQEGDPVVINWQPKCERCVNCRRGRQDLCENIMSTGGPRVFWRNEPLGVMLNAGTFCRFTIVPEAGAVPIPKAMPLTKAALLGCGVATGVGAALHTARVQAGEDVVVLGCGGVGLNVVQGARLAHARAIIAVDRDSARLELAPHYGATHTIVFSAGTVAQAVGEITGGRGVDHAFEVVGLPELMLLGVDLLAQGGTLTLVGAAARDATLPLQPRRFMSQQKILRGCIYGNVRPAVDLPLFAELYARGALYLDELEGRHLALEDVPQVFSGELRDLGIRPLVVFPGNS